MTDRILILDFGSQVTQLIARRVRESGVYCEILPFNASDERIRNFGARGIILSGGPASTVAADSPRAPEVIFELGVPLLGQLPLVSALREGSDDGRPITAVDPDSEAAQVFATMAETIDVSLAPTRRHHPELKIV